MVKIDPIVNKLDKKRLEQYIEGSVVPTAYRLRKLLDAARAVGPDIIPPDVITMNSHVRIRDPRDGSLDSYVLAYPDHDDPEGFAVSVLSPLGAGLLAAHEGQEVSYPGARGMRTILVESLVYQPERAGDHNL